MDTDRNCHKCGCLYDDKMKGMQGRNQFCECECYHDSKNHKYMLSKTPITAGGGSGGSGKVYVKDKIIQIMATDTDEDAGRTLGLSESGRTYELDYEREALPENKFRWKLKGWKLLVESPRIEI